MATCTQVEGGKKNSDLISVKDTKPREVVTFKHYKFNKRKRGNEKDATKKDETKIILKKKVK